MLERRRASVQSLLDDVVLAAQELLQDARPPDVTRESLACPVRRTTPSIRVAETEDCAFGHREMLCHNRRGCDFVTFLDEYAPTLRSCGVCHGHALVDQRRKQLLAAAHVTGPPAKRVDCQVAILANGGALPTAENQSF